MTDALDHVHHTRQIYDASDLGRSLLRAASAAAALALLGGTTVGIALFQAPSEAAARDVLHLGTAAIWDVPATGDAGPGQVVRWDDSRLTDARTPLAHGHATADILGLGYYATGTDASYLTGTLADARLSSNVALRNADNAFSVAQTIAGSAPASVSAGQVAIGGGTGRFASSVFSGSSFITTGANQTAAASIGVIDFLSGVRLQSYGVDNSTYGPISLIQRTANAAARTPLAVSSGGYVSTNGYDGTYGYYWCWNDAANDAVRGYIGYGSTLFSTGSISSFGIRSQGALHLASNGGADRIVITSGGVVKILGLAPGAVGTGEVHVGGGDLRSAGSLTADTYVYGVQAIYAGFSRQYAWTLGGYTASAPSATGYVTITINGTTYKLLAST